MVSTGDAAWVDYGYMETEMVVLTGKLWTLQREAACLSHKPKARWKMWRNTVMHRSFHERQSSVDHWSNTIVAPNVRYSSRCGQTVLSFCIF